MGERKGVNKYYPPDYDPNKGGLNKFLGTHALRERARKLHLGILIIRFEMPYNIWCEGCENHIGTGVRYNAEKKKVGMYYTTPVYQFRMKCHLCDNHFEIRTDPANLDYEIISGARRQERRWDPSENDQVAPEDKAVGRKMAADAMFRLEHSAADKTKAGALDTVMKDLEDLQESRWADDFSANQALRQKFRKSERAIKAQQQVDASYNLDVPLLPPSEDDARQASLLAVTRNKAPEARLSERRRQLDAASVFASLRPRRQSASEKKDIARQSIQNIVAAGTHSFDTFTNDFSKGLDVKGIVLKKRKGAGCKSSSSVKQAAGFVVKRRKVSAAAEATAAAAPAAVIGCGVGCSGSGSSTIGSSGGCCSTTGSSGGCSTSGSSISGSGGGDWGSSGISFTGSGDGNCSTTGISISGSDGDDNRCSSSGSGYSNNGSGLSSNESSSRSNSTSSNGVSNRCVEGNGIRENSISDCSIYAVTDNALSRAEGRHKDNSALQNSLGDNTHTVNINANSSSKATTVKINVCRGDVLALTDQMAQVSNSSSKINNTQNEDLVDRCERQRGGCHNGSKCEETSCTSPLFCNELDNDFDSESSSASMIPSNGLSDATRSNSSGTSKPSSCSDVRSTHRVSDLDAATETSFREAPPSPRPPQSVRLSPVSPGPHKPTFAQENPHADLPSVNTAHDTNEVPNRSFEEKRSNVASNSVGSLQSGGCVLGSPVKASSLSLPNLVDYSGSDSDA